MTETKKILIVGKKFWILNILRALTIVNRPPLSIDFNMGNVSSRNSSNRLRNADTESSSLPLPN